MAVNSSKTGVLVNMTKELKLKLEDEAMREHRSLTNLINHILEEHVATETEKKD